MIVNRNTQLIIYGAGEVGINTAKKLEQNGYKVIGFIDANKEGLGIVPGYIVYNLEKSKDLCDKNPAVIVALANGSIHQKVSNQLYELGFKYIIFLPLDCFINRTQKEQMIDNYNAILHGNADGILIEEYSDFIKPCLNENEWIVKHDAEYVWGYLNEEILFSESYENWKGDKTKLTGIEETYDRNIVLRKWYIALFDYLSGKDSDVERYFEVYAKTKTEDEKKILLADRQHLYEIYNFEFNRGMGFFIETAPLVEWNEKGYFNLVGGHHRTIFLLIKGLKSYPVKMSKEDFNKWCNREKLGEMKELCKMQEKGVLNVPIPHPAFSNFWHIRENGSHTILESILEYLRDDNLTCMSAIDISSMEGFLARIMGRAGIGRCTCIENENYNFVNCIFELLQISKIDLVHNIHELNDKEYDIVFDLNVKQEQKDIVRENKELFKKCKKYLFVELQQSENELANEISILSGMKEKQKLMSEVCDGIKYDIYVFRK